jgi:GrpB-like predicted nucleotidyltransferase (UPF0157 family)
MPVPDPATSEEYLRAVTVGELKPHDAPIQLCEYDSSWPSQFEYLAAHISRALGANAIVLEHVGSTSVPGLAAKPIIDMVLAVPDSGDEPAYVPALEREAFTLRIREPEWFRHRLLRSAEIESNLHVFSAGCEEIGRMLAFRDWLRAHDDDRKAYERAKRELATRTWKHVQHYADAKTSIVREILARAIA